MKTLILNLPDTVDIDNDEALMAIASKLYEKGKLSLGQAVEIVNISNRAFMELVDNYGVSILNDSY